MTRLDDILKKTSAAEFSNELVDFIVDPNLGGLGHGQLAKAPALVKGFIFVNAFYITIGTSGIYKWPIELYDGYPSLAEFFDKIGASRAATYVRAVLNLFPGRQVPKDIDQRLAFCDAHEDELDALDRVYRGASEDALLRFRDYIMAHRDEFESQVRTFWKVRRSEHNKMKR